MKVVARKQGAYGRFTITGLLILAILACVGIDAGAQSEDLKTDEGIKTELDQALANVEGRLTIAGSDTMRPLLVRLAADFHRTHPKAKIAVEGGGSTQGLREFVLGLSFQRRGDKARGTGNEGAATVTVFASSRPLTESEHGRFVSRFSYEPIAMPIALDAVALYVHASNSIPHLSLEQLAHIYGGDLGDKALSKWAQLGVPNGRGESTIDAYGRDNRSGTRSFFSEIVLHGNPQKPSVIEEPGSASEVLAIARNPNAIGYAGIGFNISEVRIVPLIGKDGVTPVAPTAETVTSGEYPLSRPLYLYVNSQPGSKMHPVLQEFLQYVNSQRGQTIVKTEGAFPLSPSQREANNNMLHAHQK